MINVCIAIACGNQISAFDLVFKDHGSHVSDTYECTGRDGNVSDGEDHACMRHQMEFGP